VTNQALKVARYGAGAWTTETVDDSVDVSSRTSIGVDGDGVLHVTYYDSTNQVLRYATSDGCAVLGTVDDTNCDEADGVDADGDGVIAAASGGSDCGDHDDEIFPGAVDVVGDGVDQDCDGADGVDADRDGHASTTSGGPDCDDMDPAVHPGAKDWLDGECAQWSLPWYATAVAVSPLHTSQSNRAYTIDANGHPHIVYYANGGLQHLRDTGNGWETQPVSLMYSAQHPSIEVGSDGYLRMTIHDTDTDTLRYVTNTNGTGWSSLNVDLPGNVGQRSALFLSAADDAHISYYDQGNDGLKYAGDYGFGLAPQQIDDVGSDVGRYSDLLVAPDDTVHVAYGAHDAGGYRLRYASMDPASPGVWALATVDDGVDMGTSVSIGRDDGGAIHILYGHSDYPHDELRHATNASGAWASEVIATGRQVGAASSLAVGVGSELHASFQGAYGLGYALYDGAEWAVETAIPDGTGGESSFITLDGSGTPRILFQRYSGLGDPFGDAIHDAACLHVGTPADTDCSGSDG
jgi:hypothetical protein